MSRTLDMQTVSTTAMYMMEGFLGAESKLGRDTALYPQNTGMLETVSELAAYAEISEREIIAREPQDFPGVYDYEVSEGFGA